MTVVSMSKQEFSRLEMLLRVQSGRLRTSDGCALIGLRRRQVFRLLRGLKQDGATSLLSKRAGFVPAISSVASHGIPTVRSSSRGSCVGKRWSAIRCYASRG